MFTKRIIKKSHMSARFNRKNPSRRSGRSLIRTDVTHWLNSLLNYDSWVPTRAPLNAIFHSSIELQNTSCNLVFYDRDLGEVHEYPFPAHKPYQPILVSSFRQYFDTRRLGLECYCGLVEDKPQFLKVKIHNGDHYMSCMDCGLYLLLDKIRKTADFWGVYPSMDKNEETQPATVSRVALLEEAELRTVRRSKRRVSDRAYNAHKGRHTADLCLKRSSSAAVEELLDIIDRFHEEDETGRASSSSPVPVEELLKEFYSHETSKGKGKAKAKDDRLDDFASYLRNKNHKKWEDRLSFQPSSSTRPVASSSKISQIRFCRFCDLGMVEESIEEHEEECWADQLTAAGPAEPSEEAQP